MMDEMRDINCQSDIRQAVEGLVREKRRQKLLAEAREISKRNQEHWRQRIRNYQRGSGCEIEQFLIPA